MIRFTTKIKKKHKRTFFFVTVIKSADAKCKGDNFVLMKTRNFAGLKSDYFEHFGIFISPLLVTNLCNQ